MWCALSIYPRRIDAVSDQSWLMLYGFVDNAIQLVVRHDFQHTEHEFLSCLKESVVSGFVPASPPEVGCILCDFRELRRTHHILLCRERRMGTTSEKHLECVCPFRRTFGTCFQEFIEIRNHDWIH